MGYPHDLEEAVEKVIEGTETFNILCLDGGGIRGVLTAQILLRLKKAFPDLLKNVHMIAGASTGGILALKMAKDGEETDFEELVNLYKVRGPEIFKSRDVFDDVPKGVRVGFLVFVLAAGALFLAMKLNLAALLALGGGLGLVVLWTVVSKLDELFRANYAAEDLEHVLKEELGPETTMRQLKKSVLIPTFDMRNWNTKFFDNLPGHDRDLDQKLWEVARCTSAAPTYWPSRQWSLDGGLFANNPSDSAVATVIRFLRLKALEGGASEEEANKAALGKITVLSIGTGENPHKPPSEDPVWDAGILEVIPLLLNVVMDGAVKASTFRTQQGLNGRFVRINPQLPNVMDLADLGAVPNLIEIANLADLEPAVKLIRERWQVKA